MRAPLAARLCILGVDPGSRFCGHGTVRAEGGARLRHVAHGVLVLDERLPIEERLLLLFRGLGDEIARHRPDLVAVEEVFHAVNARSALVLGQARGAALLAAAHAGLPVRGFPPALVKQAVTGSGRADKAQVGRMVQTLLGVRVEGRADATDALAVALCGLLRAGQDAALGAATGLVLGASPAAAGRLRPRVTAQADLERLIAEARRGTVRRSR